jgi:hypothetical protein
LTFAKIKPPSQYSQSSSKVKMKAVFYNKKEKKLVLAYGNRQIKWCIQEVSLSKFFELTLGLQSRILIRVDSKNAQKLKVCVFLETTIPEPLFSSYSDFDRKLADNIKLEVYRQYNEKMNSVCLPLILNKYFEFALKTAKYVKLCCPTRDASTEDYKSFKKCAAQRIEQYKNEVEHIKSRLLSDPKNKKELYLIERQENKIISARKVPRKLFKNFFSNDADFESMRRASFIGNTGKDRVGYIQKKAHVHLMGINDIEEEKIKIQKRLGI